VLPRKPKPAPLPELRLELRPVVTRVDDVRLPLRLLLELVRLLEPVDALAVGTATLSTAATEPVEAVAPVVGTVELAAAPALSSSRMLLVFPLCDEKTCCAKALWCVPNTKPTHAATAQKLETR